MTRRPSQLRGAATRCAAGKPRGRASPGRGRRCRPSEFFRRRERERGRESCRWQRGPFRVLSSLFRSLSPRSAGASLLSAFLSAERRLMISALRSSGARVGERRSALDEKKCVSFFSSFPRIVFEDWRLFFFLFLHFLVLLQVEKRGGQKATSPPNLFFFCLLFSISV